MEALVDVSYFAKDMVGFLEMGVIGYFSYNLNDCFASIVDRLEISGLGVLTIVGVALADEMGIFTYNFLVILMSFVSINAARSFDVLF